MAQGRGEKEDEDIMMIPHQRSETLLKRCHRLFHSLQAPPKSVITDTLLIFNHYPNTIMTNTSYDVNGVETKPDESRQPDYQGGNNVKTNRLVLVIVSALLLFTTQAQVNAHGRKSLFRWQSNMRLEAGTDTVTRAYAKGMEKHLGTTIEAFNRPGAQGSVARPSSIPNPPTDMHGQGRPVQRRPRACWDIAN